MDWIVVSTHAADRWHERTDSPGIGPVVAWSEAERRDVPGIHGDEVRYHDEAEVILVAKGGVLVTVIDVASARPRAKEAITG